MIPVTRLRPGPSTGTDSHNKPIPGPDVPVSLEAFAFDPGGSHEPAEGGRTAVVTTPKLYFQTAVDLVAADRVKVRDLEYTVEGDPALWVNPFTNETAGTVVELKRVTG